jgi:two-component system sensor histidine kinase QseC
MKRCHSLQRKLFWVLCVALFSLGLLSSYVSYRLVRRNLTKEFDYALVAKARTLASLVRLEAGGHLEVEFAGEAMPEFEPSRHAEYFEIRDDKGTIVEKSKSFLGNKTFPASLYRSHFETFENIRLPDGRKGRLVHITPKVVEEIEDSESPSHNVSATTVSVVVARERESLDHALSIIATSLLLGAFLVSLGGIVIVLVVLRRGLHPVRHLAEKVASIQPESLDVRVTDENIPCELLPVAQRVDDLLDRLATAFERERRYTSDVAHELRTPLGEIRTALEIALQWEDDPELLKKSAKDALDSAKEAETLVQTLLDLARLGKQNRAPQMTSVKLVDVVEEVLEKFSTLAAERHVEIIPNYAAREATLIANRDLLVAVIRNIVGNAIEYAPHYSRIELAIREQDGMALLSVCNDAPNLSQDDLSRMCEPFWRHDASRTDRQHVGLGLTISHALCKLMRLSLDFRLTKEKRLCVTILPALRPAENA